MQRSWHVDSKLPCLQSIPYVPYLLPLHRPSCPCCGLIDDYSVFKHVYCVWHCFLSSCDGWCISSNVEDYYHLKVEWRHWVYKLRKRLMLLLCPSSKGLCNYFRKPSSATAKFKAELLSPIVQSLQKKIRSSAECLFRSPRNERELSRESAWILSYFWTV